MPNANGTSRLVPTYHVLVNGADLPGEAALDVIAVTVHDDVGVAGMFTLQLANWDMTQLKMTWSDSDLFAVGNAVEIQMGYVDNLESLMVGEITGLEPSFVAGEAPTLTVRGYDRRHRLLRGRKTRTFTQMKDSDIASQIAREAGLTAQAQDTQITLDYILQSNQTDMAFLEERARRIGYEVVVEDKTLYYRPRQNTQSEVLTLARTQELMEFHPRLTTMNQVSQVTLRGWNPREKTEIVAQASIGDESNMEGATTGPAAANEAFGRVSSASVDRPIFSQAEADQIALGQFNEMALTYITGEGMCIGRTDLRAGIVVNIEDLGVRFSGRYYVTSATHTYSPARGYRTAFTVKRNATG
jgi:uncharacterized protein